MPVGRQIIRRPRRVLYPDEAGPADDGARMFGEEEYDGTEFGDGKPMVTCLAHPPPLPHSSHPPSVDDASQTT